MLLTDVREVFLSSAAEVLETMFFTGVMEREATESDVRLVAAELMFSGKPSGRFGVRMPFETGRAIAVNFLGEDEVGERQVEEVVAELSNMLCGSVLSRLEAGVRFELSHPVLQSNTPWQQHPASIGHTFALEEGTLTMWLLFQENFGPSLAS